MTILVKKVFISSKPTFVYLLCPPLCGPFSIQESAAGGLSYKVKKWLKPILFTAGGALVGLAYYYFVGCSTGACPLTSNPFITMAYMGFIGWLLSGVFGKGCSGSCNMQ